MNIKILFFKIILHFKEINFEVTVNFDFPPIIIVPNNKLSKEYFLFGGKNRQKYFLLSFRHFFN